MFAFVTARLKAWSGPAHSEPASDGAPDRSLLPVFAVVWLASILRVTAAFACHERFGTEATLALLTSAFLPLAAARSAVSRLRRCWSGTADRRSNVVSLVDRLASRRKRS